MHNIRETISKAQGIIVFTGAGVSTSCGIPDYRSPSGLYANGVFLTRADISKPAYTDLVAKMRDAEPSIAHHFCAWLHSQSKLIRVYTQNIDRLHHRASLPEDKIVEMHGSIDTDVVFFGEDIPKAVYDRVKFDLIDNIEKTDLVIVMGTSLSVHPFAALPNMVRKSCTRIFVNNDLSVLPSVGRKRDREGSSAGAGLVATISSYVSICGRKVTTKPTWLDSSRRKQGLYLTKWKHQHLIEDTCDSWCEAIMSSGEKAI